MATWNSPQPLRITKTKPLSDGSEAGNFDGFTLIASGDQVPPDVLTVDFIGNCLDQLANLSQDDFAKLETWKANNPRFANKWRHLEMSPGRWRTIFPHASSILTVGGSRNG